jgi:hypothetical protein
MLGKRISQTCPHLYLKWFKAARLRGRELEAEDEEYEQIFWRGVKINLEQLKDWVVRHIESEPMEHRISMVKHCE